MKRVSNGTILVTTLWMLTLLILLAIGIGMRAGIETRIMSFFLNSRKAHYIAEAGLRKAIFLLEKDASLNVDSLNELWSSGYDEDKESFILKDIKVGEGAFTISSKIEEDESGSTVYLYGATDEAGRININEADPDVLLRLPGFTQDMAAAVADWRDEDEFLNPCGAEGEYYENLDAPYECKNEKFSIPEELMLVKDITRDIYDGVKDFITVYGGDKAVNINTAPREVLAILVGSDFEDLAKKINDYRKGADEIIGTRDDNVFTDINTIGPKLAAAFSANAVELNRIEELKNAGYIKVMSSCFRIRSRGEVKNGRIKKTIEAVVRRTDKGCEFLYYYEI